MSLLIMTQEQIYTAEEVAAILRVHPRTIHRLIKRGELDAFTISGEYRIRQSALDEFMRRKPGKKREDQEP